MDYVLIENETVTNVIVLYEGNAHEFPNAVKLGGVPAQPGDTYTGGIFYRNGEIVLSAMDAANEIIAALDTEVVELTYQYILLELAL